MRFSEAIPEQGSVVVEDHRWLARLAHRKYLYFLSARSPLAEYFLIDRKMPPITNVPDRDREAAIRQMMSNPEYLALRCEDGVSLYVRRDAYQRDGDLFTPYRWDRDREVNFSGLINLRGYSFDKPVATPGKNLVVTLYWEVLREPIGADYTVFLQVLDKMQQGVAQHDLRPHAATCPTTDWKRSQIVRDAHTLSIKPDTSPGEYEIRIGLYTLADMKRLSIVGPDGAEIDNSFSIPLLIQR